MTIVKSGDVTKSKKGEFHFICKHCRCEWYGDRGKDGLKISFTWLTIYAYMKCPNCDRITYDRDNR